MSKIFALPRKEKKKKQKNHQPQFNSKRNFQYMICSVANINPLRMTKKNKKKKKRERTTEQKL